MLVPEKKRLLCILFCAFIGAFFVFPQNLNTVSSATAANRKTATRYLKIAEQYVAAKNWQVALSNAELGLAYDDTVADLYYLSAVAKTSLGEPKYKIIPVIQKTLSGTEWVDYNRESARVLYADLLCATGQSSSALEILDEKPFIYSADAEYIRSKSYYSLNDFQKAREKLDAARRIYPEDRRFAELFFRYEYAAGGRTEENARLADVFISEVFSWKNPGADLEIFAAIFSTGEQKIRRLKSFKARNLRSPLFAVVALEDGINLLSEEKALDYFYSFADKSVDFEVLLKFASLLRNDETKREFAEYLNQYNGTIYEDTDGDLTYNLKVEYSRGRPQKIVYDSNQDDLEDWSADCDFGVPLNVFLPAENVLLEYSSWPAVKSAVYKDENGSPDYKMIFNLVPGELLWTPFLILPDENLKQNLGADFFVPSVNGKTEPISAKTLLAASSSYTIPSKELRGAYITVSVLDGQNQMARYYQNEKMYAQTQFSDGLPEFRTVDMDGDGLFETTETYGYEKGQDFISENDEIQVMTNLFGEGSADSGIYVKLIQIDGNGDTIPDFSEEYTAGQGKICSWDFDGDGNWDVRYVKNPAGSDGTLIEESLFYEPLTKKLVTVTAKNGIPYSVKQGERSVNVVKAADYDLYWLGNAGSKKDAEKILKTVNQSTVQSVCSIVQNEERRMLAVRIGQYVFGEILPDEEIKTEKVENE